MAAVLELTQVQNPSELEIGVFGPAAMNRLWIYTGIAKVTGFGAAANSEDLMSVDIGLNLSLLHQRRFAPGTQITSATAIVGLAAFHGTDSADNCTWAVASIRAEVDAAGTLRLFATVYSQGKIRSAPFGVAGLLGIDDVHYAGVADDRLELIGYQVNVLTSGPTVPMPAMRLRMSKLPKTSLAPGSNTLGAVRLSRKAPRGAVVINLAVDHPNKVRVPRSVRIAAGHTKGTFKIRALRPATATEAAVVRITAAIAGSHTTVRLRITGTLK